METQVCFVEHRVAPEREDPVTGWQRALEGLTERHIPELDKGDQGRDAVAGHPGVWVEGGG